MSSNIALILSLASSQYRSNLPVTILRLVTEQENTCVADHNFHLSLRKSKKEFLKSYFHKFSKCGKVRSELNVFLVCTVIRTNHIKKMVSGSQWSLTMLVSQSCPWQLGAPHLCQGRAGFLLVHRCAVGANTSNLYLCAFYTLLPISV